MRPIPQLEWVIVESGRAFGEVDENMFFFNCITAVNRMP